MSNKHKKGKDASSSENMKKALELVSAEGMDKGMLSSRATGLCMVLLSVAEAHSERISKLIKAVSKLEDKVFSDENMNRVLDNPSMLLAYYKWATKSLDDSSSFVGKTLSTIDFEWLKNEVLKLAGPDDDEKDRPVKDAQNLLKEASESFEMTGVGDNGKVKDNADNVVDAVFSEVETKEHKSNRRQKAKKLKLERNKKKK